VKRYKKKNPYIAENLLLEEIIKLENFEMRRL